MPVTYILWKPKKEDCHKFKVVVHLRSKTLSQKTKIKLFACVTGGALAEGFQARLQEFQNFEQTFEVGISLLLACTRHWLERDYNLNCLPLSVTSTVIKRSPDSSK